MKHALIGTLLLISSTALPGQERPSLTWEGDVNGTAVLIIQGDRVTVDSRSAASVARTSYRFRESLDARERVEVESRTRTARVRVVEQPRRNNNFTALVEVDTRGRSAEHVELDFYWEERGRALSRNSETRDNRDTRDIDNRDSRGIDNRDTSGNDNRYGAADRTRNNDRFGADNGRGLARWSGQVDNEVFVLLRGRQFFSTAVRGRTVYNQQTDITNPMPRRPVNVVLQDVRGRGEIEIAEHPSDANNFTAKVRILDPESGAGSYSFALAWDEAGYNQTPYSQQTYPNPAGVLSPGGSYGNNSGYGAATSGGVRWSAQVDGRVRVSFRDNQATTQRISGQRTTNEQVSFGSSVPRQNLNVSVNKLRGRGDVDVIQRPSANNNYTAVIEIDDKDGGSDFYDIEVRWQ